MIAVVALLLVRRWRAEVVTLRGPAPGLPIVGDDPVSLLRAGRKIDAIRRYREVSGVGLKEAKEAIERLERGHPPPRPRPFHPPALPSHRTAEPVIRVADDVIEHEIRSGNMINAIKLYREQKGVGIREAKAAVEAWNHRIRAS